VTPDSPTQDNSHSMDHMPNYGFRVQWSDADAGYVATCPEFPGLSAVMPSADAALAELRVVLEGALDIYREEGWELPPAEVASAYSGQFRLRVPPALHAELARGAERDGVSLNSYIVTCLSRYLGRQDGIQTSFAQASSVLVEAFKQSLAVMQVRVAVPSAATSIDVPRETPRWLGTSVPAGVFYGGGPIPGYSQTDLWPKVNPITFQPPYHKASSPARPQGPEAPPLQLLRGDERARTAA
jgi:predicted HicB family RNase H-like nuclease